MRHHLSRLSLQRVREAESRWVLNIREAYSPRSWAQKPSLATILKMRMATSDKLPTGPFDPGSDNHGLRRNHAVYGQQGVHVSLGYRSFRGFRFWNITRASATKAVPRITAHVSSRCRGNELFSGYAPALRRTAWALRRPALSSPSEFRSFLNRPEPHR